jgi:hypothetical protein
MSIHHHPPEKHKDVVHLLVLLGLLVVAIATLGAIGNHIAGVLGLCVAFAICGLISIAIGLWR